MSDIPRLQPPAGWQTGADVRIFARELVAGEGVVLEPGVRLVADRLVLGDGVRIGRGTDVRAGELVIGAGSEIGPRTRILCADAFGVGAAARIGADVDITARVFSAGRLLFFGPNSSVGYGGTMSSTSRVRIGDRVALGPFNIVNADQLVEIGDDTGSGSHVSIWTHGFHFAHRVIDGYGATFAPVRLGSRVWLGYHCSILPGVTIGDETIVAAGAVVTKPAPARVLLGGVPAVVKTSLQPVPLNDEEAEAWAEGVVEAWATELDWKGRKVQRVDGAWIVNGDTGPLEVRVVRTLSGVPRDDVRRVVICAGAESAATAPAGTTYFLLRTGDLIGDTDEIVEDLRDHLRRQTVPCGDEDCFSSLPAESFRRLLAVGDQPV